MTKKLDSNKFLNPADAFHELLISLQQGEMTDQLARMIIAQAEKYSNHRWWVRYTHLKEDIIAQSIYACTRSWSAFRPMKNKVLKTDENGLALETERVEWDGKIVKYDYNIHNNPFAFFTQVMKNELRQFIKAHYKQVNIMNELLADMGEATDYGYDDYMKNKLSDEHNEDDEVIDNVVDDEDIDETKYSDEIDDESINDEIEVDKEQEPLIKF